MKNCPRASDTTLTPVGCTVTWAPIKAPFELSMTRPAMVPLPVCACATGMSTAEQTSTNRKVRNLCMGTPSNLECKNVRSCGEPSAKFTFDKGMQGSDFQLYPERRGENE